MYFERRQINSDCVFPAAHALVQARGRFSQKNKNKKMCFRDFQLLTEIHLLLSFQLKEI